jgi:hypothetical protein
MGVYGPSMTTTAIDDLGVKKTDGVAVDSRYSLGLPGLFVNVWKTGTKTFTLRSA